MVPPRKGCEDGSNNGPGPSEGEERRYVIVQAFEVYITADLECHGDKRFFEMARSPEKHSVPRSTPKSGRGRDEVEM